MTDPLFIGIDVGTTSVKAALIDGRGRSLRSTAGAYPVRRPAPGVVEQNPNDWMELVLQALRELGDGLPSGTVAGIGLCSQVNTHVFTDDRLTPLLPAIVWQDGRCAAEALALDAGITGAERMAWWGAPLPVDASHVLSRIAWVTSHCPDVWARTRWVLAPKDYCLARLTGAVITDPMTAFGVIDSALAPIAALTARVPGAASRLPPMAGFTARAGRVAAGLPCAGTPVAVGTMDAWAGFLGAGARRDGDAVYLSGTSEILGLVSRTKVPTPGVIAFPECEGLTIHAGPTQSGGASVAWLGHLIGRTVAQISELAAAADPDGPVPVFLPHLQGERAPLWDITARASFSGLDGGMGPAELARAVFEGVAYSARWLLGSLEASAACRPPQLTLAGGGAASGIWCQIRADVLGRPLQRSAMLDAGVLGSAMLAAVGAGAFGSIAEAQQAMVRPGRVFHPDPKRQARHDQGFARYQELYRLLKPFNAALAQPIIGGGTKL